MILRMKISFGVLLSAVWAASSHGWTSEKVSWVTLDEAKEAAKTNGKPTMILIHKRCVTNFIKKLIELHFETLA